LLKQGIFSNRFATFWLIGMIGLSLFMTIVPFAYPYFHTMAVPLNVWMVLIAVVLVSTWWMEINKLFRKPATLGEK